MKKYQLEINSYSVQSVINAQNGGAQRVELCDNFPEGGTTPSYGTILLARGKLDIQLYVIVRPRGGDFLYSDIEFEIMKKDIEMCKKLGVDGVVIGILNADGTIDKERTRELVDLARPMDVTFHRAFDMTRDPWEALEDLIGTGVNRVLTSGQERSCIIGRDLIKKLVEKAGDRIIIMPGDGLEENNIEDFARFTRAKEFHCTARTLVKGQMKYRNTKITMGGIPDIPEYDIYQVDEEKVRNLVEVIKILTNE
jgi:copper homeostasis protein